MDIDSKSQEQGVAGASTSAAAGQAPASGAMHAEAWHESGEFVNAPFGLFPQPLGAKQRLEPNNQVCLKQVDLQQGVCQSISKLSLT